MGWDEFFSLPLFPRSSCAFEAAEGAGGDGTATAATGGSYVCGTVRPGRSGLSQCSSCGTTCAGGSTLCPRCGSAMTQLN